MMSSQWKVVLIRLDEVMIECSIARLLLQDQGAKGEELIQSRGQALAVQVNQVPISSMVNHGHSSRVTNINLWCQRLGPINEVRTDLTGHSDRGSCADALAP